MSSQAFKIGYLPMSKVNWTNDKLEAARTDALEFLRGLPGVEVLDPGRTVTLEEEAVELLEIFSSFFYKIGNENYLIENTHLNVAKRMLCDS